MKPHPAVQARFWTLIERSFPARDKLEAELAKLDAKELVALAAHVIVARNQVRNPAERPLLDATGEPISALNVEDFTDWIVGRGQKAWAKLRDAPDSRLLAELMVYLDKSTPSLLGEVFRAHAAKSGEDLNEAVDAYLRKLG